MTFYHGIGLEQMAYTDSEGPGRVILFVHGLPTSKELFDPVIESLPGDYRTISVDLLDYGESSRISRPIEHRERARNIRSLIEELDLRNVIVVCHDLGASVTMDLMAICPERVGALVIMNPPVYPDFKEPTVVRIPTFRWITPGASVMI